jgi:hypothetical protein
MNLIQCQGIDSLEVIIGWRNCDYNDRKKRVKNMGKIKLIHSNYETGQKLYRKLPVFLSRFFLIIPCPCE